MTIVSCTMYYFCFCDYSFPNMTSCPAYAKVNTQTIADQDNENVTMLT